MRTVCTACAGTGKVWPKKGGLEDCFVCEGLGSRRAMGPKRTRRALVAVYFALLWALLALAVFALVVSCTPGRQFVRTGWIQNGTRNEEIISAGYSAVGRYFSLGEGVKASAYTGTYYDADGDVPYALIGGNVSWDAGAGGTYSLTLDGYAPEDWEDAEYYLSASSEWPWP